MDIVEFLRARLAEDEAEANAADSKLDRDDGRLGSLADADYDGLYIGRFRVLREVGAKRRIVERHHLQRLDVIPAHHCERDGDLWPCADLRDLATGYATHPDYQQEWKP